MTSKEALEYFIGLVTVDLDKEGAKRIIIIKKDLDRLEKLEKENKVLKEIIKDNFSYFEDSKRVFFNYTEPVMEKEIREVLENE